MKECTVICNTRWGYCMTPKNANLLQKQLDMQKKWKWHLEYL